MRSTLRSKCASRLSRNGNVPFPHAVLPRKIGTANRDRPLFQRPSIARLRQAALCLVIAIAAWPVWAAGDSTPKRARSVAATSDADKSLPDQDGAQGPASAKYFSEAAVPSQPRSKPVRKSSDKAAAEPVQDKAVVTDAKKSKAPRKSGKGTIAKASFQNEADRVLKPIPDLEAPRESEGINIRPFRKIYDIVPYDNYEPDPELAGKDRCNNLCPRPRGGDCPDCNAADTAEGTQSCPECPGEQDLRRIGRKEGEPDIAYVPRDFAHIHYCWEPTNLYHNPIYFEDVPLERYGHTRHYLLIQPFFSVSKFALQLVGLPYQMSLFPMWDRQYSLGYYRPGEYVPYKYYQIPLNAKAAAVEAGVIAGSYFIFAPGVGP